MELKISIEKRHLWLLALLIVAVGFVIAQGGGVSHPVAEITGLNNLIDQKIAASQVAQNKNLVEWKLFSQGTQVPFKGSSETLASATTNYGRLNGAMEQRGCRGAMDTFCRSEGYNRGIGHPSCGWDFDKDRPCPDVTGCSLSIACFKTAK